MSSENTKVFLFSLFLLLAAIGVGFGLYVNTDKHDPSKSLVPLVIGSWVKIPGICDGKTHYDELVEILSKQSMKVKGKVINIVDFSISKTAPIKISCDAVGDGDMFVQTSFMADKFFRYYLGKIGDYTIMKSVAPRSELWFKLDTHFQQKLQAMSDINNGSRL
ncbi:hypothetical protein [Shewanella violacea]|uniref:Uncharacterized protein n=1 Tax=Shewanella violacea (strain JCM 10179 / CIP 106290 / LMG 19151 / DSS12) TaxID=637905 RepID=D4ZFX8_SHEVD|nr:hypothetical protein [Shewanella violacea]BAJ00577.1 hypothetical protein SVI_0606 [Shewanella violacea DSS12]